MTLKHFVLTRIGLGIYNEEWFERMCALFMAVTAPSLSRQTSQDFHWLIVVDVALAGAERRALDEMAEAHSNFHIVTMDVTRMTFMRLGGHDWIWEPCHQFILETGLIQDPSEYVITSTIDADDAWATDYIALINTPMNDLLPTIEQQEVSRGSHLRHSNGAVLTFGQGLRWFIHTDGLEARHTPYHSMAISVLSRLSSGLSALSNRHKFWPRAAEIAAFQVHELSGPHPMWLHVRHDFSTQPWQANDPRGKAAPARSAADMETEFGVDMGRVHAWRERYPGGNRHEGQSTADQYARLFRLTGLNRHIAALEPRAGSDPALAQLLARQRVARDELIARLRQRVLS